MTALLDTDGNATMHLDGGEANITPGGDGAYGYRLAPLADAAAFIAAVCHLSGILPADAMRRRGVGVTKIAMLIFEKVEEAPLHATDRDKRIAELDRKLKQ